MSQSCNSPALRLHCLAGMMPGRVPRMTFVAQVSCLGSSRTYEHASEVLSCLQVDILIVACSCFAPTPSLASMVVNKFSLRTDCLTHNIAGMGCSAGVIAVDMARMMLQVRLCCFQLLSRTTFVGQAACCPEFAQSGSWQLHTCTKLC